MDKKGSIILWPKNVHLKNFGSKKNLGAIKSCFQRKFESRKKVQVEKCLIRRKEVELFFLSNFSPQFFSSDGTRCATEMADHSFKIPNSEE